MAIGERIRFIRNLRSMTQKWLGAEAGFDEKSADVRIAQYESGTRTPKEDLVGSIAHALGVAPEALTVPDIDSYIGLMHTFFALEDLYGLKISNLDGEICLTLDKSTGSTYKTIADMLSAWQKESEKLSCEAISQEEYNEWRYNYPKFDTTQKWGKVPSQKLSDFIVDTLKEKT